MSKHLVIRVPASKRRARRETLIALVAVVLLLHPVCAVRAEDMVLRWNSVLLAAVTVAGQSPVVASRTIAIVQAAVYDAVNSIDQSHMPYLATIPAPAG